jgi:hypothetical protein
MKTESSVKRKADAAKVVFIDGAATLIKEPINAS